ncbi:MAG: flagellar export protein FliJ [Tissierellales bacterium]
MEKFKFRLEKILEYRERIEDINKTEFGKAKKHLNDEIVILEEILSHKDSINVERDNMLLTAKIKDLRSYSQYLDNVKEKLTNQKDIVEKAENKVEKARKTLIISSVERKTLENLKDRDFDNYLYDVKKEEDKVVDQIVSYQSSKKYGGQK